MKKIATLCVFCLLLVGCQPKPVQRVVVPPQQQTVPVAPVAPKIEGTYSGTWLATNRRIDGTMMCVVSDLGGGRWKGTFSGVWHGRKFSYNVDWTGTPNDLRGTAVIDGANYQWTGSITANEFKGTFIGNRYKGSFDLRK